MLACTRYLDETVLEPHSAQLSLEKHKRSPHSGHTNTSLSHETGGAADLGERVFTGPTFLMRLCCSRTLLRSALRSMSARHRTKPSVLCRSPSSRHLSKSSQSLTLMISSMVSDANAAARPAVRNAHLHSNESTNTTTVNNNIRYIVIIMYRIGTHSLRLVCKQSPGP